MRPYLGLTTREVQRRWLTPGMAQRVVAPLPTTRSLYCQRQSYRGEVPGGSEAVLGTHGVSRPEQRILIAPLAEPEPGAHVSERRWFHPDVQNPHYCSLMFYYCTTTESTVSCNTSLTASETSESIHRWLIREIPVFRICTWVRDRADRHSKIWKSTPVSASRSLRRTP